MLCIRSRTARRGIGPAAVLLSAVALFGAVPARAADVVYGLVVGIDDYVGTVNDLNGAVNDAEGIANALKQAGAKEIRLLTNGAATKAAIQKGWYDLVSAAQPGETVVFSYAGHGAQEPEPPGWQEPNGKSDNFILGGYEASGPASAERIVDWEMFKWLKAADEKGVKVVFVADSCHSGTMFRGAGSKAIRYRTAKFPDPDLAGDLLKLPDPSLANVQESDFRNVTFVGATQDNMLTPELTIDGVPHGALSWAFAKAIAGAADSNKDGHLSQQELLAYIVPTVQVQSENQQIPSILPLRPDTKPIMRSVAGSDAPPPPVAADDKSAAVRLLVRGGVPADLPEVPGIVLTEDEAKADLIWDRAAKTVDHRIGGRVAENVGAEGIAAVLSKWSALAFIKERTGDDPVGLSVASGNQRYKRGEEVRLAMTGERFPYLTLFNLPPDGRVEFFWPENQKEVDTDWRGRDFSQDFRVDRPPFGAEHMVAILTAQPALALHEALKSMPTAEKAGGLAATLRAILGNTPFQAGVVGIYTDGGE
jgi:hypothetical protein